MTFLANMIQVENKILVRMHGQSQIHDYHLICKHLMASKPRHPSILQTHPMHVQLQPVKIHTNYQKHLKIKDFLPHINLHQKVQRCCLYYSEVHLSMLTSYLAFREPDFQQEDTLFHLDYKSEELGHNQLKIDKLVRKILLQI